MTLLFCDSFDHYATAQLGTKWDSAAGAGVIGSGRFGSGYAVTMNSTNSFSLQKLIAASATVIVGFAFRVGAATNTFDKAIVTLGEVGLTHIDVRLDSTQRLYATRNGTNLGMLSTSIPSDTWVYIELKATIHDTLGFVELKLQGASVGTFSGDTRNAGAGVVDRVTHATSNTTGQNQTYAYDDVYICDAAGAVNNDFLGDIRVEALFPNGDGTTSQLVGSDGNSVNNSLLVDEAAPNSDTDYVESSTVGDKDTYAFGNLTTATGTVLAVVPQPFARKTDAGVRSIVSVARLSGVEADGAAKTLSVTYDYLPDVRETKPGGGAWSIADVNAAEFGVKVNA